MSSWSKTALFTIFIILIFSCTTTSVSDKNMPVQLINTSTSVKTGLDVLFEKHIEFLYNKNIAIVTNHSGVDRDGNSNISKMFANDSINLTKIFSPEHGFTGNIPAGEYIQDDSTLKNMPAIFSLYGKTRKPSTEMLRNIDLIVYDIQDVGARFYTYISTLGLVMEAAAEANIPALVLDRPNPISNKSDGPILNIENESFIGMYPIPIQYGMTIGELAKLIVGENLIDAIPNLTVIPMDNYSPDKYFDEFDLRWVKPSPNIPDLETAIIYPGLCLFESTNVSEGRGTLLPFKQIGAPWINSDSLANLLNEQNLSGVFFKAKEFTPKSIPTMSQYPKYQDKKCGGIELSVTNRNNFDSILTGVTTLWAINNLYPDSLEIRKESLARIWGSDILYQKLAEDRLPNEIINSYQSELELFQQVRNKYLIYQ